MCGIRPREVRKQRVTAEEALQRFGSPSISMDSGEHSDGAPAQINYAEPASVLSPDPRHQGNINRIIGGNPAFNFYVLGGVDAKMNGYPWVVQLKMPNGQCGGTVINSRLEFLNTFGKLLLWLSSLPIMYKEYYNTQRETIATTPAFIKRIFVNHFKSCESRF